MKNIKSNKADKCYVLMALLQPHEISNEPSDCGNDPARLPPAGIPGANLADRSTPNVTTHFLSSSAIVIPFFKMQIWQEFEGRELLLIHNLAPCCNKS